MRHESKLESHKGWLQMDFAGTRVPQLVRTSFLHARLHDARWKQLKTPLEAHAPALKWTKGPQALAILLLKTIQRAENNQADGEPARFMGKPERTLFETLRKLSTPKETHWATQIFGYDEVGEPFIAKLLHLFESGSLCGAELQQQVLRPQDIQIRWEDQDVSKNMTQIKSLINAMNSAYFFEPELAGAYLPSQPQEEEDRDAADREGGLSVKTGTQTIAFDLDGDFPYPKEDKERLKRVIGELLELKGPIRIIICKGSVRATLALTPDQAEKLYWAIKGGELDAFGARNVQMEEYESPQPSVPALLLRSNLPVNDVTVEETGEAVILRGAVPAKSVKGLIEDTVAPALAGRTCYNQLEIRDDLVVLGRVTRISSNYVIVDIGYECNGAIHLDQWYDKGTGHIVPPSLGDQIEVLLDGVEDETGTVVLSFYKAKRLKQWHQFIEKHKEGDVVSGVVANTSNRGLIVNIGVNAFLPLNEVDIWGLPDIAICVGQTIECKVIVIDKAHRNVVVSHRKLLEDRREEMKAKLLGEI